MAFIKATQQECESYNDTVTQGEGYNGTTTRWAEVIEIEGEFYVAEHPEYSHSYTTVDELPIQATP